MTTNSVPSRDVIRDLLPLYVAGEASADTRALVEAALAEDSALAREAEALRRSDPLAGGTPHPPADHERRTLERVHGILRARGVLLGLAIFFTLMPFSFFFSEGRVQFLAMRDAPATSVTAVAAALACWMARAVLGRRLARG
jgi:anti-sigma factor RsiW